MDYAEKLTLENGRADAIQRVFNRWTDRDVTRAIDWLKASGPSAERDPLHWYFMTDSTYRYIDRSQALVCAPLIVDAEMRARAIEHVVLIWAREDAVKASQYVEENSALDETHKKAILKKISAQKRPGSV